MAKALDGRSELAKSIKGDLYNELRTALMEPLSKSSKMSWSQSYIKQMLKTAKDNPNSPVGQLIARQLMTEDIIEKLDQETDKYLSRDIEFNEFRLLRTLYDKQREVFLDETEQKKIVIGSRRIGKTELAARLLLKECLRPNRHALFISLKFENAIRQCFTLVSDLAKSLGLPVVHESKADGEITFSNGSYILFKGNANNAEASKLLGYKYSLVVIDEVQNQCNLKFLLDDVLRPTMADYEDSHLLLIGTPPRTPHTVCETIWNEWKGWKHYSWDLSLNPYIKNVDKLIKDICEEKGVNEDSPFIKREYKGLWAYDEEAMVFKGFKTYTDINPYFVPTHITIGTDYGYADNNAIITLAYNIDTKESYVINESVFNQGTVSMIVDAVQNAYNEALSFGIKRNANFNKANIRIVADTNERSITQEIYSKGLPAYNAYKYDRLPAMEQLSDWCRTGKVLTKVDSYLAKEFQQIVHKRDEQDNILTELDDDLFHPDATMALLYAARQMWYDCGYELGGTSTDQKIRAEDDVFYEMQELTK